MPEPLTMLAPQAGRAARAAPPIGEGAPGDPHRPDSLSAPPGGDGGGPSARQEDAAPDRDAVFSLDPEPRAAQSEPAPSAARPIPSSTSAPLAVEAGFDAAEAPPLGPLDERPSAALQTTDQANPPQDHAADDSRDGAISEAALAFQDTSAAEAVLPAPAPWPLGTPPEARGAEPEGIGGGGSDDASAGRLGPPAAAPTTPTGSAGQNLDPPPVPNAPVPAAPLTGAPDPGAGPQTGTRPAPSPPGPALFGTAQEGTAITPQSAELPPKGDGLLTSHATATRQTAANSRPETAGPSPGPGLGAALAPQETPGVDRAAATAVAMPRLAPEGPAAPALPPGPGLNDAIARTTGPVAQPLATGEESARIGAQPAQPHGPAPTQGTHTPPPQGAAGTAAPAMGTAHAPDPAPGSDTGPDSGPDTGRARSVPPPDAEASSHLRTAPPPSPQSAPSAGHGSTPQANPAAQPPVPAGAEAGLADIIGLEGSLRVEGGFSTSIGAVSTAGPGAPSTPAQAASAAQQMAGAMPRLTSETGPAGEMTEIALDPPELGRVRMVVSEQTGVLTLTVSADRPETLELLRRNVALLAQEFAREGLDGAELQFGEFSDRGDPDARDPDAAHDPAAVDPADANDPAELDHITGSGQAASARPSGPPPPGQLDLRF